MTHLPSPRRITSTSLLTSLIEAPDLALRLRALPAPAFSALVRRVGVEDAGEIVALATTEQLVAAFDEDLFSNDEPGQRERFDVDRFVVWLEVLLEAGDEVAAARSAELSVDFLVHALSQLMTVIDDDALRERMVDGDDAARRVDKALESGLLEEIDGYLLVARRHDGWDAALALVLALDRDHRELLLRLLDRCAGLNEPYLDDLDALAGVLSGEESLADDVEAERETRRSAQGYVEPRAARAFLALAQQPLADDAQRDANTRAYFRDLEAVPLTASEAQASFVGLLGRETLPMLPSGVAPLPFIAAMQRLGQLDPDCFAERVEELAYLTNVLMAGASIEGRRFRPFEAAEAVLATVALGAGPTRDASELVEVLRRRSADLLFRRASSRLTVEGRAPFLRSREQLPEITS